MSEATVANVEEEAQVLGPLLQDYAAKLIAYNGEVAKFLEESKRAYEKLSRVAWLLDSFETIRKPLVRVLSRASALVEHSALTPMMYDAMVLRLAELESQLHHADRQTGDLNDLLRRKGIAEETARLRAAAGLSAMKGGPLRPDE